MQPRFRTVVFLPLLNASLSDINFSMDWLCEERVTVSFGSSWRVEPRDVRW